MDTDSFIVYIKTEDIYLDIAKDVEARFDTSFYELNRTLSKGRIKKVIGLLKDELSRKIMTEFAALRPNTYSYLRDDNNENKKAKAISRKEKTLKFEDYKNYLEANQLENKI